MDFELSEEYKILKRVIRDFAESEVASLVDEAEKNEAIPIELFRKMGRLGYLCPGAGRTALQLPVQ